MYVQITNYSFKGEEEKAEGIRYLQEIMIPYKSSRFGFISYLFAEGQDCDVFLLCRYKVRQNTFGPGVDRAGFKKFYTLLSKAPAVVQGPNRAANYFRATPLIS